MLLFIDTSNSEQAHVALVSQSRVWEKQWQPKSKLSETLMIEIKKLLTKAKISFSDIKKIGVVAGPGHFSKIRTGVVVANSLSFALDVPVFSIEAGHLSSDLKIYLNQKGSSVVLPIYDKEANITQPK